MDPNTPEVTTAPETEPQIAESLDERLAKSLERNEASAATESAPEAPKETPEAEPAAETTEPEPEEIDEPKEPPVDDAEPFTEEQLRDPAFFDKLDREGWKKLEDWNPALYRKAKAVYSALGKANQLAQQSKPQPAQEERSTEPTLAERKRAAFLKSQSLDENEAEAGFEEYQSLLLEEKLPQLGFDPVEAKAVSVAKQAYEIAVADVPELADFELKDLDAEVDSSPRLMRLVNKGDVESVAIAMALAAESLVAKRQVAKAKADADRAAAEKKKADEQRRLKSNANNPANAVTEASRARVPSAKRSVEEVFEENLSKRGLKLD